MSGAHPPSRPLTILVCTYNRAADLAELLDSVLGQLGVATGDYEILVVDNNSSDGTRRVVEERAARSAVPLRYVFEGRQGKSNALNTGLTEARGEYYAVIDDDLIVPETYVRRLLDVIQTSKDVSAIGGKVLPLYARKPPGWLTSDHWAPIAMADFGEDVMQIGAERQVCLMAATLRRADVLALGGYRTDLGVRGRTVIGGTEDAELMQRLWRAGHRGVYLPHLVLQHKVPARRLTRSHFLKWHYGHGRARALDHNSEVERSRARVFGVPAHMYRAALRDAAGVVKGWRRRDGSGFRALGQLAFFAGFLRQRIASHPATDLTASRDNGATPGAG